MQPLQITKYVMPGNEREVVTTILPNDEIAHLVHKHAQDSLRKGLCLGGNSQSIERLYDLLRDELDTQKKALVSLDVNSQNGFQLRFSDRIYFGTGIPIRAPDKGYIIEFIPLTFSHPEGRKLSLLEIELLQSLSEHAPLPEMPEYLVFG